MNRKHLAFLALPFVALPVVACGPGHSAEAGKAKTAATVEDTQLKADGYTPFRVPLFGKADVGIKGHSYEAVVYTGKLTGAVVDSANKHKQPGVSIKAGKHGTTVVDAASLSSLKSGVKTVVKSL